MIERYTLPAMGAVWTEEARMRAWLDVEIAAVRAWNALGKVPDDAVAEIVAKADFDPARVAEIEATTNHDVIAFLTNVAEYVGDASKYVHYGMTELRHARHRPGAADQARRRAPAGRPARARPACSSGARSSSATPSRSAAPTASTPSRSPSA